jgi:hypothetical protein
MNSRRKIPPPVSLEGESVAGEEDPGASLDTVPGDAAAQNPAAGQSVCSRCGGSGRFAGALCPTCGGAGKVIRGVGGG